MNGCLSLSLTAFDFCKAYLRPSAPPICGLASTCRNLFYVMLRRMFLAASSTLYKYTCIYVCLLSISLFLSLSPLFYLLFSLSSFILPCPSLSSPFLSLYFFFPLSLLYLISSSLCPLLSFPVFPLLYILSCLSLFLSLLCSISSSLCPLLSSPSLSFSLLSFLSTTHPSIERCMRQTPQHITVKMMFNDAISYHIILL